jgi:hypothetical protein
MNQFDFPSAAALNRLKSDVLSTSRVSSVTSSAASIGSSILDLAGFQGVGTLASLSTRVNDIRSKWMTWWDENKSSYLGAKGMALNSSATRLQATGLIASVGPQSVLHGSMINDYELLIEGKKFYEGLQEILA